MSATRDNNIWSALYDYKKMVGYGFFTRNSRKEFIKEIEKAITEKKDYSKLLREFSNSLYYGGDTGFLGQSRLYGLLIEQGILHSKCQGFHPRHQMKQALPIEEEQNKMSIAQMKLLRDFTIQLKASTSFWYGGFLFSLFRSQRKEMAFNIIILALDKSLAATVFFKDEKISADPAKILRYILHNAMINRGSGSQTSSGLKAIALLEDKRFEALKKLLPSYTMPNYNQLKEILAQDDEEKQDKITNDPYRTIRYYF